MPELRKDPVVNRLVMIAPERAERPDRFFSSFENNRDHLCPFCAGNERESPGEVLALDKDGNPSSGKDWQVRVVTNKYPALTLDSHTEMWILPKRHFCRFESLDVGHLNDLGMVLKSVVGKLYSALDGPPYNFLLHTAPFHRGDLPYFHWHIEIFPRITRVAGFEWGSGFYINTVLPEEAARTLRDSE